MELLEIDIQKLQNAAREISTNFKLDYSNEGVEKLENLIEEIKKDFVGKELDLFVYGFGAFVGETMIRNYGGRWVGTKDDTIGVEFYENNMAFPFAKVQKQVENGLQDSVASLYKSIPIIFKIT